LAEHAPIITLTTDFGTADPFVGTMKGVILGINPDARIVDLSHEVAPHDIVDGAFRLRASFAHFPPATIHVVVVDPGVGSARRPILMTSEHHRFVAPDNGVLTMVPDVETVGSVYHMTAEHYFRSPVSNTFHGRDVFAPAAAWLSRGLEPAKFGDPIGDWVRLDLPKARISSSGAIKGTLLSSDRFGNAITNIPRELVEVVRQKSPGALSLRTTKHLVTREVRAYEEITGDAPAFLFNSLDLVEIALNRRSAIRALGLKRGDPIELQPKAGT